MGLFLAFGSCVLEISDFGYLALRAILYYGCKFHSLLNKPAQNKQPITTNIAQYIQHKIIRWMLQKYTKFCSAETLIKSIQSQTKDEQSMHILLSVFKKSLSWVEEKFDREGLFDAIPRVSIKQGIISQPLVWIFVIRGRFSYHDMPFYISQYIKFTQPPDRHLNLAENSLYAVLTMQNWHELQVLHQQRQIQKMQKFIKTNMFHPFYLQDHHVRELYSLLRIKRLRYNKCLNWKDEDKSNKIAAIFRGVVNIEYQWKRTIEVAQLATGMYIANHYIKDQIQEIQELELQQVDQIPPQSKTLPKFRYVSKSDDTVLLIFNARLLRQSPYNVNPNILPKIKSNYQKYAVFLQNSIGFAQFNKFYRNKSSIKEELKKQKAKDEIKKDITLSVSNLSKATSPILKTYATLQLETNAFDTVRTIELPEPTKLYSKSVFTTIPNLSPSKISRSKTTQIQKVQSSRKMIHNTWLQEVSKQKKQVKSFSMLKNLTTYYPGRHKKQQQFISQMQAQKKPEFFVPEQFVKRKLKLKYEGLIQKMRNMDLSLQKEREGSVSQKMQRLQEYIDSKRIVKISNAKRKFRLLRDKVLY